MSLSSGARISRHQWTELPIPDTAIARVNALGFEDDQPLIQEQALVVEWRPDHPIDDSEYDRDYALPRNLPVDVAAYAAFDPVDADEARSMPTKPTISSKSPRHTAWLLSLRTTQSAWPKERRRRRWPTTHGFLITSNRR